MTLFSFLMKALFLECEEVVHDIVLLLDEGTVP